MKKFFALLLLLTVLIFPSFVSAHAIGQPPYFKVNGVFTDYYPVPSTSLADFDLPQDIVKDPILVNQELQFEIDKAALPVPAEVVEATKFSWEFGDGGKAEGLKNSHTYSKPGTYFMKIYAQSEDGFEPQLLQSTAINVVPSRDYKLPKAIIEIDGRQSKDPLLDILDVNFTKEIKFDGSNSEGGGSQISEYFWDLGDQSSQSQVSFQYEYKDNPYTVFPLLRIKTVDGFIADGFVQVKDENAFSENKGGALGGLKTDSGYNWGLIAGIVFMSLVVAGILTFVISKTLLKGK